MTGRFGKKSPQNPPYEIKIFAKEIMWEKVTFLAYSLPN
jgi:hypothetical protein